MGYPDGGVTNLMEGSDPRVVTLVTLMGGDGGLESWSGYPGYLDGGVTNLMEGRNLETVTLMEGTRVPVWLPWLPRWRADGGVLRVPKVPSKSMEGKPGYLKSVYTSG